MDRVVLVLAFVSARGHHLPPHSARLVWPAHGRFHERGRHVWRLERCHDVSRARPERGDRKNLLRVQGILRLLSHGSLTERVRAWMRAELLLGTNAPYKHKIMIKPFTNQEWGYIYGGGYVEKDMGKQAALPPIRLPYDRRIGAGAFNV